MVKILEELRQQHQTLLNMISEDKDIFDIIKLVEEIHHPLEEQALFPLIADHPLLQEGGPLCTFFRGMELDLNPKSVAEELLKRAYAQGLPRPHAYPQFTWLNEHNPLSMPMGEHVLSDELAQALLFLKDQSNEKLYKDFFVSLKIEYIRLLKLHIAKEDGCLFVLCEKLLS
ncbi:hypothetical protein [Bdellovibrio bacteriovorus]|uniref:hypothetical protein n=1 Tax=Bdellovibrio bacteriovorus TaxID=959 RepID=UPI0035A69C60